MNNVINLCDCRETRRAPDLMFTQADKQYLRSLCDGFRNVDLPHELVYGVTDEGQEWCLVRKLIRRRERSEWTSRTVIVAEITVTPFGYRHCGNWGDCCHHSLKELFAQLMPSAYNDVREGVQ